MPLSCTLKMVVYGSYTSPLEREREGEKEKGKGKDVLVRTPLTIERAPRAGPSAFIARSWKKLLGPTPDRQYRQAAPNSVPFLCIIFMAKSWN